MKYPRLNFLLLLAGFLLAQVSVAHEAGITDTGIKIFRDSLKLTYTVPQKLADTLGTNDATGDNTVQGKAVAQGISILNAGSECSSQLVGQKILDTIDSVQFFIGYTCQQPITSLVLDYNLFFDQDDDHSNIVRFSLLGTHQDNTITSDQRQLNVDVESMVRRLAELRQSASLDDTETPVVFEKPFGTQYFPVGFWHILLGYDHVLFLICLVLLPMSPLVVLSLVTSFTVAHSITLSLSALNIVTLQPKIVESIIALSIVYVSVRTLVILRRSDKPLVSKYQLKERTFSSFLFGLVHGFGFSYHLKEIGLGDQIFASLLFFNLGVEAGQLAILAPLLTLLWWLGKHFPSWYWASVVSIVTGLFGLFWFIERTLAF